jgi:hypothetical protein
MIDRFEEFLESLEGMNVSVNIGGFPNRLIQLEDITYYKTNDYYILEDINEDPFLIPIKDITSVVYGVNGWTVSNGYTHLSIYSI